VVRSELMARAQARVKDFTGGGGRVGRGAGALVVVLEHRPLGRLWWWTRAMPARASQQIVWFIHSCGR
jgi:hypothetical protein